jgi:hypothetical protein
MAEKEFFAKKVVGTRRKSVESVRLAKAAE